MGKPKKYLEASFYCIYLVVQNLYCSIILPFAKSAIAQLCGYHPVAYVIGIIIIMLLELTVVCSAVLYFDTI